MSETIESLKAKVASLEADCQYLETANASLRNAANELKNHITRLHRRLANIREIVGSHEDRMPDDGGYYGTAEQVPVKP